METTPQPAADSEESKRQAKRRYIRQYHLNRYEHVSPEELPLFATDPLREEKLGWTAVIVCRLCGLKLKKLPQHLSAEHGDELRQGNDAVRESELALNYKSGSVMTSVHR